MRSTKNRSAIDALNMSDIEEKLIEQLRRGVLLGNVLSCNKGK
jgi:hypothetical protein